MQWTGIAILNAHAGELCYGDDVYSFHLCKDEIRRDVTMGHEVPVANKSSGASAYVDVIHIVPIADLAHKSRREPRMVTTCVRLWSS